MKMNVTQLLKAVQSDSSSEFYFIGVFASDELPSKMIYNRPCALFANTDESSGPGVHWVLFWLTETNCYFIDSLGDRPGFYSKDFENFLKFQIWNRNKGAILYSPVPVQGSATSTCGEFCLYMLYWLSRSPQVNPKTLMIDLFHPEHAPQIGTFAFKLWQIKNDKHVYKFVQKNFLVTNKLPFLSCRTSSCKALEKNLLSN